MIFRNPSLGFQKGDLVWGYQLPHLLAMHFQTAQGDSTAGTIHLYFSTESVVIEGKGLRPLWENLVHGRPTSTGQTSSDGCTIEKILRSEYPES